MSHCVNMAGAECFFPSDSDQSAVNEEIAAEVQSSDNEETETEDVLTQDDNSDDDLSEDTAVNPDQTDVPETPADTDRTESAVDSGGEPDTADEMPETEEY